MRLTRVYPLAHDQLRRAFRMLAPQLGDLFVGIGEIRDAGFRVEYDVLEHRAEPDCLVDLGLVEPVEAGPCLRLSDLAVAVRVSSLVAS